MEKAKEERIDIRVSSRDKEIFKRAQGISGEKSISSFIIRSVREKAEQLIAKEEAIFASERDKEIFFKAVFNEESQEPTPTLVAAVKEYFADDRSK